MPDLEIYTVAWICAIGVELVAAKQFLDELHDDADQLPADDDNTYVLGKIGKHNIVITALPQGQYGLVSAAIVARDMVRSFANLRFALMVGIGGGAPTVRHDIRLGDIVVSSPDSGIGGVLQYDLGKTIQNESFHMIGHLNQPPQCLLRAIPFLDADYESDGNGIQAKIIRILEKKPLLRAKYGKPDSSTDRLFSSVYKHAGDKDQECASVCIDPSQLVVRPVRPEEQQDPMIYFGLIASANQLMKDAIMRDRLSSEKQILCFEMEAAGLMNHFPCLVIRGICDYSDTHKNKIWQGYAAMAAAAYAKDLIRKVAPNKIEAERRLVDIISGVDSKLETIDLQVKTTHAEIKTIRMEKRFNDIDRWLAPLDISSNFNKAIKARHPGSGRRLLENEAYATWKKGENTFLWLYGIPGCGKTILASTIIEDLKRSLKLGQNPSKALLYFYFDFTDSQKQSFEKTLRSLICQIYYQNEVARRHLDSLYSPACRSGKDQPSFDHLQRVFADMVHESDEVWIVLDALDECTPRRELLSWLSSIAQDSLMQVNTRLVVTSRPEQDIKWSIQCYASDEQIIAIQDDLLEADIRNYVHARVHEDEGLSRWRGLKDVQDKIEASLIEKANGMFRWVSCQLDTLEDCLERRALLYALQSLPKTLDETYERILANIPSAHVHHTRRILQFLVYSERPLRLSEAVDAIAVDIGKDVARGYRFDPHNRLPVPEEITRYCSSLVAVVSRPNDRYSDEESTIKEIQLAHFSVKDYLTSDRVESTTARFLQETFARTSIAEVCLVYLLEHLQSKPAKETDSLSPFVQYSAQYWADFLVVGEKNSEYAFELAKELLLSRTLLESCYRLIGLRNYHGTGHHGDDLAPALYYASLKGLPRCVKMLLDNGADANAKGGSDALYVASCGGHRRIVQLLVDSGANVNAERRDLKTALSAASLRGYQRIVRILIDNGATVNLRDALFAASSEGYYGIVELLIDNGAMAYSQDVLDIASTRGYYRIVQLLIDSGANVNTENGRHGNALCVASFRGYPDIVQLLISKGADVNAKGGEYGNALCAASFRGYSKIVQLLISKGADVNAKGGEYGNALCAASFRGHQTIVQLLIDKGATVSAEGGRHGNALRAASSRGHQRIVKLLIENGALNDAHGGQCGNDLQAVLPKEHQENAESLLKIKMGHNGKENNV